jgi:hypothetical protein
MNTQYPIIKIPEFLTKPNFFIDTLEKPSEPVEPLPPKIKHNSTWYITLYILIGVPILSSTLGIPGLITSIILLFVFIKKITSSEEIRNNAELKYYEIEINNYKRDLEKYYDQLSKRDKRMKEMILIDQNPLLKLLKIINVRQEFLASSMSPSIINQDVKKGVTESIFFPLLISTFKDMVSNNKSLLDYTPDFVYFNPLFNLFIDIEIDEPYDAISKAPIHYLSADEGRDSFFLRMKWCVIRFSEKQIVEQPNACCDEIKRLVNSIFLKVYDMDQIKETLEIDNVWTINGARKMAMDNYRDTYLSKIK